MADIDDTNELSLILGDIIKLKSSDMELHNYVFFIDYIDEIKLGVIREDGEKMDLVMDGGAFVYDDITDISIMSRPEIKGYARQNGLLPGKWIKILFKDDFAIIGKIEGINEDRIELITDGDKIYIDFGYSGLPSSLGIVTIDVIDEPSIITPGEPEEPIKKPSYLEEGEIEEGEIDEGEIEEGEIEEGEDVDETQGIMIEPSGLVFGDIIGKLSYEVIAPVEERRYGIEKQTTDMLNGFLSKIPAHKRTQSIMREIMRTIERYTELRELSSVHKSGSDFSIPDIISHDHKPAIHHIMNMDKKMLWCIPVTDYKKIIYKEMGEEEADIYRDLIPNTLSESQQQLYNIIDAYRSNSIPSGVNNHHYKIKNINKEFMPLFPPSNDVLYERDVETNIFTLSDTLGGFSSTVVSNDNIMSERFISNEYTPQQSGIEITKSRGESHVSSVEITPADRLYIKSMITLPMSLIGLDNVHSMASSILAKTNIDNVRVKKWKIFDNDREIKDIEVMDTRVSKNKMREIRHYIPQRGIDYSDGYFREFLNSVIPSISNVIKEYSSYTRNNNVMSIIRQLNPFMIEMGDINYKNYRTMCDLSIRFNEDYKKKYNKLKSAYYAIPNERNMALNTLYWAIGKSASMIYKTYPFISTVRSSNELRARMMQVDSMRSYNTIIKLLNADLFLSQEISKRAVSEPEIMEKEIEPCDRVLSKAYGNVTELNSDNGIKIYFDKQYDRTLYEIVDKYKEELELLPPEQQDQLPFIITYNLIKHYGFDEKSAEIETENIMNGRKEVVEGNYAVIKSPKEPNQYYIRTGDLNWVRTDDEQRDEMTFCNTSAKCISIKGKCMDAAEAKDDVKSEDVHDDMPERIDIAEYKSALTKELENNDNMGRLLFAQMYRNKIRYDTAIVSERLKSENLVKLPIGWTIQYSKRAARYYYSNKELDVVQWDRPLQPDDTSSQHKGESPHGELRDMILAQQDFEKKQSDILRFSAKYTRTHRMDEDPNWLYCNESDIKLMPVFLPQLAQTYVTRGNYEEHLVKVVSDRGIIGGCGGHIVDKNSGYVIMTRPFDTAEEYTDDGFKDIYRSIIEDDVGDIMKISVRAKDVYGSREELHIVSVINAMVKYMAISLPPYMLDSILSHSMKLLSVVDKSIRRASAKTESERESTQLLYNKSLVIITLSYLHIHIQTAIPSVISTVSYPGCKKSFRGYPTYEESTGGIEYIGCIANTTKSQIEPWNGISKMNRKKIIENIRGMIEKFILPQQDIQEMIERKLDYYEVDESEYPVTLDMLPTFLPPLRATTTKPVTAISESHISSIIDDLKNGLEDGIGKIGDLKSKLIPISNVLREKIQDVVHGDISTNNPILMNNMGEPYIKNACCSSNLEPLSYMVKESSDVGKYITMSRFLSEKIEYFRKGGKPSVIFDDTNTRRVFKKIDRNTVSSDVIYRFIIDRCNYDNDGTLPRELNGLCMPRPLDYDTQDTFTNKINNLKANGHEYDNKTFMDVVRRTTPYERIGEEIGAVYRIHKILDDMNTSGNSIFSEDFSIKLYNLFDDERKEIREKTVRDMKNYLSKEIKQSHIQLISILTDSGLPRREITNITKCIENLFVFPPIGSGTMIDIESETGVHTLEFVKSVVEQLGITLPNIILNRNDYSRIKPPKHWKLSPKHIDDFSTLIRNYYEPISSFYSNKLLDMVLSSYIRKSAHIHKLIDSLTYTTTDTTSFMMDPTLTFMLSKYSTIMLLLSLNSISDEIGSDQILSDKQELGNMTSRCTMKFLNIVCKDKETIDYNYDKLMDRIGRAKEKEKTIMTDYLKDMTEDARNVERVLKQHKLGKWSLGEQKGYREYQGDMYDKERDDMEERLQREINTGHIDIVSRLNTDIYDRDPVAELMEEREINDISHIGEDNDNAGEELDDFD